MPKFWSWPHNTSLGLDHSLNLLASTKTLASASYTGLHHSLTFLALSSLTDKISASSGFEAKI